MGACKCIQATQIIRSDLFVPNIAVEPTYVYPKKLLRLKTLDVKIDQLQMNGGEQSTEKFIREKSSFFRTVNHKNIMFDKSKVQKAVETQINKTQNPTNDHTITLISNTTNNEIKEIAQKANNIECEVADKHYSSNEEKMIADVILHHFFFYTATSNIINYIFEEMDACQINEKANLFTENQSAAYMYIIKSGKVELSNNDNQIKEILSDGATFGEIALIKENAIRKYSANTLTTLDFYTIDIEQFSNVAGELFTNKQYQFPYLKYIEKTYQQDLGLFIMEMDFKKGHSINNIEGMFGVIEGKLRLIDKNNTTLNIFEADDIYGLNMLLLPNQNVNKVKIIVEENSKCFVLPFKAFKEIFGLNYQHEILYSYFKCAMLSHAFFCQLCNDTNIQSLFELFKVVEYSKGTLIYTDRSERKIILLLDGEIIYETSKKRAINHGEVFGEAIVNEGEYVDDLIANKSSIVFECTWETFSSKALIKNIPYTELINTMKQLYLINQFNEKQMIKLGNHITRVVHKKGDIVIKANEPKDKFYFVEQGTLKQIYQNKVIRHYNRNNSFGEIFLLNTKEDSSETFVSSKEACLYYFNKEMFINLLIHPIVNSYVKNKIAYENSEVFLNDLYDVATIHKGKRNSIHVVHNKVSFYVVKAIMLCDKDKQNIPNIINEKKAGIRLDNPFVIHYVKTLKAHNWCLFVEEYIPGMTLEEYFEMCKPHADENHIKFYGGSLFIILDYLREIGIVHRDILPSNIIIETSGHIKLVDFSSSKTIKNNTTKTIIGTPLFTAPEVLAGKGYSYSCDYWSVGICLYYLYYGTYPFGAKAKVPADVYKEILNKKLTFKKEDEENIAIQDLLTNLLQKNPFERFTDLRQIKQCLFFQNYDFEMLNRRKITPPFFPQIVKLSNEKVFKNITNPFRLVLDKHKVGDYEEMSMKLHKDVVLTANNEERIVDPHWFKDF